jgi:hypothetical protein
VPQKNLLFLYAMEAMAGMSRGSFLVCIGWTTLIVTGDVARVGQVFVVGMLTNILAGPLLGTVVDRFNRKFLALVAHLGIGLVMATAGLAIESGDSSTSLVFFATTITVFVLRLLYELSHDGLIRGNVSDDALVHTIARFRTIHLLATAAGTVLVGVILDRFGAFAGFTMSASMSILLLLPVIFVKGVTAFGGARGLSGYFRDLLAGFAILLKNPTVRLMALLAAVALPVGQLSNAVLSSFIHDDLGMGGDVFGMVDSAWPLGGMAAAGLMSLGLGLFSRKNLVFFFSVGAGTATVVLSISTSVPALVFMHGAMGFFVWFCRILIDARVLLACGEENVGRAKVCIHVAFSLSAALMCLSPSFVPLQSTSGYFLFWGSLVVLGSLVLGAISWLRSNE